MILKNNNLKPDSNIKKLIVIAEDNPEARKALESFLKPFYHVKAFENGEEAMTYINNNTAKVDLLVTDDGMPLMSGFEVLTLMKSDPNLAHIPVIMQTGNDDSWDCCPWKKKLAAFLIKPVDCKTLLVSVKKAIQETDLPWF